MFDDESQGDGEAGALKAKKKGRVKLAAILAATLALAAGAAVGLRLAWQGAHYLSTDNARVTTNLIAVAPAVPGTLERFAAYEGRRVARDEVIGWVGSGEAMRSPVDGVVIRASAVQGQLVSPMEPVAVIADSGRLHVLANVEETSVARLRVGQRAEVTIDPFGSRRFAGYVREIGQATAAELAGQAVFFNTGGNFTRVTHLIPVKIGMEQNPEGGGPDLDSVIGVNARVRIAVRSPAREAPPPPGELERIRRAGAITARGVVESTQRRQVYTTLGYIVDRVYVEPGDRVAAGQILGALAAEELALSADMHILNAEAALRAAEVQLATARHNHGMLSQLRVAGSVALNDYLQSQFALEAAEIGYRNAREMLGATRVAMGQALIRAPIAGTVTAVFAREGEIGMGRLFTVEDTDSLRIATSFREYDLARLAPGMGVAIMSDATGGAVYSGVISRINPAANALAPVPEFEAEVLVTCEGARLRIGSSARLEIDLGR